MKDEAKSKEQLIDELEDLRLKLHQNEQDEFVIPDEQIESDQHIFKENLEVVSFLKQSRSFSHLTNELIAELIPHSELVEYPARTEILRQGDSNTKVFFLMRGTIRVYADGEYILSLQRKGDIFGEMSVISSKHCSATVTAETRVKVFCLDARVMGKFDDISTGLLHNTLYRIFSMILTEKLSLTTYKAKQYEIEHKSLLDEIKHRKEIENNLRIAKEEAEIANMTKNEFIANISHELRTPLNTITGYSELLFPTLADKQQKDYLQSIQMAGSNLLTLITDILSLSRIKSGKLKIETTNTRLKTVFEEIDHIFKMKAMEKDLKFSINLDPKLSSNVTLDKTRLRQILFNLVGNAIKFTEKGQVILSARTIPTPSKSDKVDLHISVEDTGIGIPLEEKKRIFESFTQLDSRSTRKYAGTGLGLAICQRLVTMMNGEIILNSIVGQGSRFEVRLKEVELTPAKNQENLEKSFNVNSILFPDAKVLVVDDVELNRTLLEKILIRNGIEVIQAEDGLEAFSKTKEIQPDLIIMDIMMPVMDGVEATRKLKNDPETKTIPVIGLTAYAEEANKDKLIEIGFETCLYKPINTLELYNELIKYLNYQIKQD
jgi:signal transduction histidine kinase/CheY-like chemotaxis protein